MHKRHKRERRHAAAAAKRAERQAPAGLADLIRGLDPSDPAHWTKGGRPNAQVLSELAGRNVSAAERDQAWKAMEDQ